MEFISSVFSFLFWTALILGGLALWCYNGLRSSAENVKEAWSNIGVVAKKQISLINQLIDVVKSYEDSEKLVMLKVSEDTSLTSIQSMVHQSNIALNTMAGMAQKFPELKSNQQYNRLIDSIQQVEAQLHGYREQYNAVTKQYNIARGKIPHVFISSQLGFKSAPYLEFSGAEEVHDMGVLKSIGGDDAERLNALIGSASGKMLQLGKSAAGAGVQMSKQAANAGKQLLDKGSSKIKEITTIDYFYLDAERKPQGPVQWDALLALHAEQQISDDTLVCSKSPMGSSEWQSLKTLIDAETANGLPAVPDLPPIPDVVEKTH
ncbi:LemA family protein [Deefgea piscis]|uniref:LemA family protein n=1 Tax=Deefgea piscis TaxID=2739061 RepID=UPI001C7FD6DA|nr:LemA family protein [Deefgea piscis]QZA81459.1 LemA family protein [Deefgea piscis]